MLLALLLLPVADIARAHAVCTDATRRAAIRTDATVDVDRTVGALVSRVAAALPGTLWLGFCYMFCECGEAATEGRAQALLGCHPPLGMFTCDAGAIGVDRITDVLHVEGHMPLLMFKVVGAAFATEGTAIFIGSDGCLAKFLTKPSEIVKVAPAIGQRH